MRREREGMTLISQYEYERAVEMKSIEPSTFQFQKAQSLWLDLFFYSNKQRAVINSHTINPHQYSSVVKWQVKIMTAGVIELLRET